MPHGHGSLLDGDLTEAFPSGNQPSQLRGLWFWGAGEGEITPRVPSSQTYYEQGNFYSAIQSAWDLRTGSI